MDEEKNIKVSDMYLAAAYLSYGYDLVETNKDNPKRQEFYFKQTVTDIYVMDGEKVTKVCNPTSEQLNSFYISEKLLFPPSYPDCIKKMKLVIYS